MSTSPKHFINRTIVVLCAVSLFTDAATEMLYPVLPLYLKEIGFSIFAIGLLDAAAEFSAAILKTASGVLSDRSGRRNIFIRAGYALSALAKPLIGFTAKPLAVFLLRIADRAGKGLRTSARDALLVDASEGPFRGRVFGMHRAMDTTGAVIGPAITLALLHYWSLPLQKIFALALIPGVIAIAATLLLPKEKTKNAPAYENKNHQSLREFLKQAPRSYMLLLFGFVALAAINSSDLFILLRQSEAGLSLNAVVGAYCIFNFSYALLAFPAGTLGDRFGFSGVYIGGLLLLAFCYACFALGLSPLQFAAVMTAYGAFAAATEGIAKAWLSHHIPEGYEATGMGFYQALSSIALLVASPLTAILWEKYGAAVPFSFISAATLCICLYFFLIRNACPAN